MQMTETREPRADTGAVFAIFGSAYALAYFVRKLWL